MTMPGGALSAEMMRNLYFKKAALANNSFALSGGGTGASIPFTPSPMPNIPFMPPAQVGPQMIPRGGNLGMPVAPGAPAAPGGPQIAVDPSSAFPAFGSSYQTPMQMQAAKAAAGPRPFNAGLFGMGANLMQRGGSSLAPMTGLLGQLMAARGQK